MKNSLDLLNGIVDWFSRWWKASTRRWLHASPMAPSCWTDFAPRSASCWVPVERKESGSIETERRFDDINVVARWAEGVFSLRIEAWNWSVYKHLSKLSTKINIRRPNRNANALDTDKKTQPSAGNHERTSIVLLVNGYWRSFQARYSHKETWHVACS